jgi:hypothetical protein
MQPNIWNVSVVPARDFSRGTKIPMIHHWIIARVLSTRVTAPELQAGAPGRPDSTACRGLGIKVNVLQACDLLVLTCPEFPITVVVNIACITITCCIIPNFLIARAFTFQILVLFSKSYIS